MKHIATLALMLNLGVADVHAQQHPEKTTCSGDMVPPYTKVHPTTSPRQGHYTGPRQSRPSHFR